MHALRITLRRLRHQPGFALGAIGALALGIAAPTALFAVVHATLLRPLPYANAENIYVLRTTMTDGRFTIGLVASAEMNALRNATDLVTQSALTQSVAGTIETGGLTREVSAYSASVGFFELFGMPMQYGRGFIADDTKSWYGSRIVLSHHLWQTAFGGDPSIVGRTINFSGGPGSLVVGVAPAAFAIPAGADLWLALPPDDSVGHGYIGYIRVKPGVTSADVQGRLGGMWAALGEKYPDQEIHRVFTMRPLLQTIVGDLGPIAVIAFAAAGVLLVIAIVNVANLLLARATARGREIAVRTALGAARSHLVRDLLVESLVIAIGATVVALPLVALAIRSIVAIGGRAMPRADGLTLDLRVFAFSAVVMIVAAVAAGLAPLVTLRKTNLSELMNEGGRGGLQGRSTRRLLNAMVVVEVALAIALVAGAGRLMLSMHHLLTIDPGFVTDGRLAIDADLPVRPYLAEPGRLVAWETAVSEQLSALGASGVGIASTTPLGHEWDLTTFVDITGRPTDPAHQPNARLRFVDPGFFNVMGMKMVAGRGFTAGDRRDTEPVVVINQAWAARFIPGLDPLRERISPGTFGQRVDNKFVPHDATIIGVVADVPYVALSIPAEPTVYVTFAQVPQKRQTIVITTANGHPEALVPDIRRALASIDPRVAIDFSSMPETVSASLVWPKLGLLLMATFGLLGLTLAATGVFGVIAFVSAQRSGEMAVRLALGGTRGHIFGLVLGQGAMLAASGLALGVLLAWWLGGPMAPYVYRVTAGNALVLAGSAAVVFAVAIVATLPSARRAAATAPARVFRT
jgi:putative ABC transport system permease protein